MSVRRTCFLVLSPVCQLSAYFPRNGIVNRANIGTIRPGNFGDSQTRWPMRKAEGMWIFLSCGIARSLPWTDSRFMCDASRLFQLEFHAGIPNINEFDLWEFEILISPRPLWRLMIPFRSRTRIDRFIISRAKEINVDGRSRVLGAEGQEDLQSQECAYL